VSECTERGLKLGELWGKVLHACYRDGRLDETHLRAVKSVLDGAAPCSCEVLRFVVNL
jgi:hypothetical protein